MRRLGVFACVLVAAVVAAGAVARFAAPREQGSMAAESGQVVSVHDGDTITVRLSYGREKVRLVGIDTPELDSERDDLRALAYVARDYVRERIAGTQVRLESDTQQPNRDKYGRLLRYVIVDADTNLNEELVRKGYAQVFDRYRFDYKQSFKSAEEEARRERRPIWTLPPVSDR